MTNESPAKPIVAIDIRELAHKRAGKANVVYFILQELLAKPRRWRPLLYSHLPITDPVLPKWATPRLIGGLRGLRAYWMARDMERQRVDLAIFPTGYIATPWMRRPYLLVVYDLVAFSRYGGTLPFKVRWMERLLLPLAARKAVHILAISEFTKQELISRLGIAPEKITVFSLAANRDFHPITPTDASALAEVRERYALPEEFLLYVGTLEPRKNIEGLIRAYHDLPATLKKAPLILVGKTGWLPEPLPKILARLGATDEVRHLDYVDFADLPRLYNLATATVYPSFYEGFGLPTLEAMAAGCPVITSRGSSLDEVVGDAALVVDPSDTRAITEAMSRMLTDSKLRQELRAKGLQRARLFSWERGAQTVNEVIERSIRTS